MINKIIQKYIKSRKCYIETSTVIIMCIREKETELGSRVLNGSGNRKLMLGNRFCSLSCLRPVSRCASLCKRRAKEN